MSKVERALKLANAALEQMREQNRCEGIPSSLICAYSWLEEIADLLQPPADTIPVRVALAMAVMENGEIAGDVACNLGVCEIEETAKDRVSFSLSTRKRWSSSPPTSSRRPTKSKPWMRR
jgi:hypothetical protein